MREWTKQQRAGIEIIDRSLLVSAAAGSGKTAVLAERCAHLVCDANPCCDVDELLVVTFTEAAAAEMRARIESALRERLAKSDSDRLRKQLALVERAQISTLHSFCARIIRENFNLLELDPSFKTLDADEAALLRGEVAREVLADRYERDDSGMFQRLVDCYSDGNDERLAEQIVGIHDMLTSIVDPPAWRREAIRRIADASAKPLRETPLGQEYLELIGERLSVLRQMTEKAGRTIKEFGGFPQYVEQLRELYRVAKLWETTLKTEGLDALAEIVHDFQIPRLPSYPNSIPGKDAAKSAIDAVRCEMAGDGSIAQLLRFSEEQWRHGLTEILPFAALLLELVEEFGTRYEAAKRDVRSVDFADLERLALRVLLDVGGSTEDRYAPAAVARMYHARFKHVLVDEYQDINGVQDAILALVSRESAEGGSLSDDSTNLFCVGDVKQSIYGFRLADPDRFMRRYHRFKGVTGTADAKPGQVIDLQSNFRSRAPLLDAINAVFKRLMTEQAAKISYDDSHQLVPAAKFPDVVQPDCFTGAPVELHLLPTKFEAGDSNTSPESADELEQDRTFREATFVARRIRQLMGAADGDPACPRMRVLDKESNQLRPIGYGDIVVLLRSLQHKAEQYADVLRTHGIPVHSDGGGGFFQSTEIRDMLALLSLLDNQRQDIPMAAVLRNPLASIPDADDALARIRLSCNDCDDFIPFHEAATKYAREKDDELAARLRDFFTELDRWRRLAHRRPLAEVIWDIYDRSGFLAFCAGLADGEQRVANLIDLHERAAQFGTFQRQGLSRFLRFLEGLQKETDLGRPSIASGAQDVVRIMSVHRSKGLEFPVVVLPDLGKGINLQSCQGSILLDRNAYLGMSVVDETKRIRYPSLAHTVVQTRLRRQCLAEELRVLYVAMTRAKEHLILVGTCGEKAVDTWVSQWKSHTGPFPAEMVLGARNMLNWLGPAAVAMAGEKRELIRIKSHTSEEIATWKEPEQADASKLTDRQQRVARLEPLEPAPAVDAVAQEVIDRLSFGYPHRAIAGLSAATSVTTRTKKGKIAPAGYDWDDAGEPSRAVDFGQVLKRPRFLAGDQLPLATDIGTATHLVLQHLDFSRACDAQDLKSQIEGIVARKIIKASEARLVSVDDVEWLVQSEIGRLLRANASKLLRELPMFYAVPSLEMETALPIESDDPLDQIMIRGQLDVLIPTGDGFILIDYKTDRVTAQTVESRAEFYRGQMELYREAIAKIARRPVIAMHLAFLHPRLIQTLA